MRVKSKYSLEGGVINFNAIKNVRRFLSMNEEKFAIIIEYKKGNDLFLSYVDENQRNIEFTALKEKDVSQFELYE